MGISVCVCLCVYVHICAHVYICVWVGINVCPTGLCVSVRKHVFVCVPLCQDVWMFLCVCDYVCDSMCVGMPVNIYVCVFMCLWEVCPCESMCLCVSMCHVCGTNSSFPIHIERAIAQNKSFFSFGKSISLNIKPTHFILYFVFYYDMLSLWIIVLSCLFMRICLVLQI